MEHDYFYKENKDIETSHIEDKILEYKAWNRFLAPNASIGEKNSCFCHHKCNENKKIFWYDINLIFQYILFLLN